MQTMHFCIELIYIVLRLAGVRNSHVESRIPLSTALHVIKDICFRCFLKSPRFMTKVQKFVVESASHVVPAICINELVSRTPYSHWFRCDKGKLPTCHLRAAFRMCRPS